MKNVCLFPRCEKPSLTKTGSTAGYCGGHRAQLSSGKILTPLKEKPTSMVCIFPECGRRRDSKEGYCGGHKRQLKKGRSPTTFKKPILICTFEGCGRRHLKQSLCSVHNRQKIKGLELHPVKPIRKAGEGSMSSQGYKVYSKNINGKSVFFYEHRVIMEKYLGRSLLPNENVHHINGDRADNRLENLELWSTYQPQGQRVVDKIKWAREILKMYEDQLHLLNND